MRIQLNSLLKIGFFSLLCLLNVAAASDVMNQDELNQSIGLAGISYKKVGTTLEITIEKDKALNAIPAMQKAGAMNPTLTQTDIQLLPISLSASVVGMQFTTWLTHYFYKSDNTLENLQVQVYLSLDEKGKQIRALCYSFDIDRATYNKMDWTHATATNLITESKNFTYSAWCNQKESEELQSTGVNKS